MGNGATGYPALHKLQSPTGDGIPNGITDMVMNGIMAGLAEFGKIDRLFTIIK